MAKTDGKPAGGKPADNVKPADSVKPADNVKPTDVNKPRKGSQNSLSLSPRWTLHVTRPFNLYKEGKGSPKRDRQQEIISRAKHREPEPATLP